MEGIACTRGIYPSSIAKLNDKVALHEMADRATEIREWIDRQDPDEKFVVIDDDLSINSLPSYIKEKCVLTKPLIGLNDEVTEKVLRILFSS